MFLCLANVKEVVFISTKVGEKKAENSDRKVPAYYMGVESNGDIGSLPCSLDVYNYLNQVEKYTTVTIVIDLDTWKREFIVSNVALAKKKD